jgi:hypothetical protein
MKTAVLFAVLLFSPMAFALSATSIQWENIRSYDIHGGKWYLLPLLGNIWINSLQASELKDSYRNPDTGYNILVEKTKVLKDGDIYVGYIYDAKERKYIRAIGPGVSTSSALSKINKEDVNRYPAMWVYMKGSDVKKLWVKYGSAQMPKLSAISLKAGWNFMLMLPEMNGHPSSEWAGTCIISNWGAWNDEANNWIIKLISDLDQEIKTASKTFPYGHPYVIKVSSDCKLASPENVPDAPGLPTN